MKRGWQGMGPRETNLEPRPPPESPSCDLPRMPYC